MLTFAQFERELASERTKDKLFQRAQKGLWNGGTVPFGYKANKAKLSIDKNAAKIVREVYQTYVEACSVNALFRRLRTKGIYFSKNRLYYLLRNPIYVGKIRYHNKSYPGQHEPIISEKLFDRAQSKHIKKTRLLRMYKYYLLAGLVKCKECGYSMTPCHSNKYTKGKMKRYYYYRCLKTFKGDWKDCNTRQVSAERLENYVLENLRRISLDKHYLSSLSPSRRHSELELTASCSKIDPDHLGFALKYYLGELEKKKSGGKNLWAKQFIQSINYSIESIQINLFYFLDSRGQEKTNPAEKICGILKEKNASSPFRSISNYYVSINLPNPIHRSRKRDIG